MKLAKWLTSSFLILIVLLCLALWFSAKARVKIHQNKIAKAEKVFSGYSHNDWVALYNSSLPLFKQIAPEREEWPPQIAQLEPYGSLVTKNEALFYWTGGFDDGPFYLIVIKAAKIDNDGTLIQPGIRVVGPPSIPERPLVLSAPKNS